MGTGCLSIVGTNIVGNAYRVSAGLVSALRRPSCRPADQREASQLPSAGALAMWWSPFWALPTFPARDLTKGSVRYRREWVVPHRARSRWSTADARCHGVDRHQLPRSGSRKCCGVEFRNTSTQLRRGLDLHYSCILICSGWGQVARGTKESVAGRACPDLIRRDRTIARLHSSLSSKS